MSFDVAGTLLNLQEPAGAIYARLGRRYGVTRPPEVIASELARALRAPWPGLRFDGDGRPFWREAVRRATGCADPTYFEEVYAAFGPSAWAVAPGAVRCLTALRESGVRVGVLSNWDTRLRSLLSALDLLPLLDTVVISGEVRLEKPDPAIFDLSCMRLGTPPAFVLHIGDQRQADLLGARGAGCVGWLLGQDVHSFDEIRRRILLENGAAPDADLD